MPETISRFFADDGAATAIEYGLIAGLVAVGCIVAFVAFGGSLGNLFAWVNTRAGGAMDGAG
ncbi:MAG: Flp family type IVb pilin [Devosia nanyangense]|uniref:Flp family type IVb pilin n=1 Tax=Devosia nanyangense TaxID=1228055 RepID=A0A933NZT1_9HYPH|nr:Flp family type IVb pilin [Devosia nanyangense]